MYSGHMRCEDYPCCGHTDGLGCNWTYTPEAAASDRIHAFCNHEAGHCEVDEAIDSIFDEDECDPSSGFCAFDDADCPECADYWLDFHAGAMMEDQWLDGSYEM